MESMKMRAALVQLQAEKPANWEIILRQAKNRISIVRRELELGETPQDIADAMTQCIIRGTTPVMYLLAAAYIMQRRQELFEEHLKLEMRSEKIRKQLKRLGSMNWLKRNIETVNEYYNNSLRKIRVKTDDIIGELQMLNALIKPKMIIAKA